MANIIFYQTDVSKIAHDYAYRIRNTEKLNQTIDVFKQYLADVSRDETTKTLSREVFEAVKYIKENYANNITLQQVAKQVEISPNYLSSLFKKELQLSFVDYINQVRIHNAKKLLLNTHLKSYEISQKVGFTDESYFSRIFKKIVGIRPNEFKRQGTSYEKVLQDLEHV